jgi:oxygen-independent coproporphyrinogen-3 oxidase
MLLKGLYIHIPFCQSICHYCDFVKRIPKNTIMIETYIDRLIEEIMSYQSHFSSISTLYIGGGTPSMLSLNQLEKLFISLKPISPIEYTIEVNPESYTHEKGLLFQKYGINRISLGVQTFNPYLLKELNRKHTNESVFDCISDLKKLGISNISVDLIYAIPGQKLEHIKEDMKQIESLDIPHISYYALILEEKTYFHHLYLKQKFFEMDDEIQLDMYQLIIKTLTSMGYLHYEISSFAKPGYVSKHNSIYWTLDPYIGVGLGAHGFINHHRIENHKNMNEYLKKPILHSVLQTLDDLRQDALIFGLRRLEGIDIESMEKRYQFSLFEAYPKLIEFIDLGYLSLNQGVLKLTEKGLFVSNQIMMEFI